MNKCAAPILVHVANAPEFFWRFLRGPIAAAQEHGFDVVAVSAAGEYLAKVAQVDGVRVCSVDICRRISPLRDLRSILRLWRLFRRLRPSVVHAHTPKGGLLAMTAAWLAGVPVRIHHVHGLPFLTATGLKRRLLRWADWVSSHLAHRVLVVSHSVHKVMVEAGLCAAGRSSVLLGGSIDGVDAMGRFHPRKRARRDNLLKDCGIPQEAMIIGFVGRIMREKGIAELLEAWQQLAAEYRELHLLLVGPMEPRDPVSAHTAAALRADDRIHMVGEVEDAANFYAAMDVLVLPTYREGFPVVPLEAAAMEVPVVATQVPGCVDAVEDGVTGTLVPAKDVSALTAAIRRYVENPRLRQQHGQAGRTRVLREFAQDAIRQALCQEYEMLLRQNAIALPSAQVEAGSPSPALLAHVPAPKLAVTLYTPRPTRAPAQPEPADDPAVLAR